MWGASAIACIGPGMRSRLLRLSRLSCSVTKVRHRATLYSYFRGEFTLLRSWAPLTCSMLGAPINFTNSFTANTCNDIVKEERVGSVPFGQEEVEDAFAARKPPAFQLRERDL